MEVEEILEQFRYNRGRFARQAVLAALEKREEITPHLLHVVEDTAARAEEILEADDHYFAYFYAFYLLAQFRERRAYPPIAKLFSLPGETCERLTEDFITEDLHRVLASVAHGDTGPVKRIIENPSANEWARSAAIRSIVAMVAVHELPRQEAVEYFRDLMRKGLSDDAAEEDFEIWDTLVWAATDLHPRELYPEIEKAYEAKLVRPAYVGLDDVASILEKDREAVLAELPRKYTLITDTVADMEGWACFEDDYRARQARWKRPVARGLDMPRALGSSSSAGPGAATASGRPSAPWAFGGRSAETISRDTPKLGRNDPCSCGSGKKYKKCCGKATP